MFRPLASLLLIQSKTKIAILRKKSKIITKKLTSLRSNNNLRTNRCLVAQVIVPMDNLAIQQTSNKTLKVLIQKAINYNMVKEAKI